MDLKETVAMISGRPVREYATCNFGLEQVTPALSVVVPEQGARELVRRLRAALPAGFVCFVGTTEWDGGDEDDSQAEVVVAPGSSQFEILRIARTEAPDLDLTTDVIAARLQRWDDAHGLDLWHAETDTVELDLVRRPQDLAAFAAEVYEICPDAVEQMAGSLEALAREIGRSGSVQLWWD
jgi:hypothetical protein